MSLCSTTLELSRAWGCQPGVQPGSYKGEATLSEEGKGVLEKYLQVITCVTDRYQISGYKHPVSPATAEDIMKTFPESSDSAEEMAATGQYVIMTLNYLDITRNGRLESAQIIFHAQQVATWFPIHLNASR